MNAKKWAALKVALFRYNVHNQRLQHRSFSQKKEKVFKRAMSYTRLGTVRTLEHCSAFVTRPIVIPTPKWRVGFGDSMAIELKTLIIFEALQNALGCLFYGGCARETSGSAGFSIARFANPRTATTQSFGDD
ncbi:hypothetical protein [Pseudomonas sp. NPDC096950]|uniref:hypothetical protein n=1 Tax=Pseudomonas sp. NPDC096950 TaxID=3364485 RepID=UPI00383AC09D